VKKSAQFCPNFAQNGALLNNIFLPEKITCQNIEIKRQEVAKIWSLFR
jgi:hypothetical protein